MFLFAGHKKTQKAHNEIQPRQLHLCLLRLLWLGTLSGGGPNQPTDAEPESRSRYYDGYQ